MRVDLAKEMNKKLGSERSIKRFYSDIAPKLIVVLSILSAAESLEMVPNVPPTRRHKLSGNYHGCWAIDVSKNKRIILRPIEGEEPKDIKEVELIDIVDYH